MECRRILAVVQVAHTVHKLQLRIGKAECGVCSFGGCKQQSVEVLDSPLLKSEPDALHIGQGLLCGQLPNLGLNDPVDTLFVDDQQTIFISEVLHILRAELDNFLECVNGNKAAVVSKLIGGSLQHIKDILNLIDGIARRGDQVFQIVNDILFCLLNLGVEIPQRVCPLLIGGVQVIQRIDEVFGTLTQLIGLLLRIALKLVEVLHVAHHELIGLRVVVNLKTKCLQLLDAIADGVAPQGIQHFKGVDFVTVHIDELLGQSNLFPFRPGIFDAELQGTQPNLNCLQPL